MYETEFNLEEYFDIEEEVMFVEREMEVNNGEERKMTKTTSSASLGRKAVASNWMKVTVTAAILEIVLILFFDFHTD